MHVIVYSKDAEALRAFLKHALALPSVDAGGAWPIFAAPPTELAAHPTEADPKCEIYLMCDDIATTIPALERHGAQAGGVIDQGWGVLTELTLSSGDRIGLYQPKHPSPLNRSTS